MTPPPAQSVAAMIRPAPGFLGSEERRRLRESRGMWFAHSDVSGISIFEEAQYQGVRAAEAFLAR